MSTDTRYESEITPPVASARARRLPTKGCAIAVGLFVTFAVVVLTQSTKLLEPDDSAYLASIIALSHGHITLSTA